MKPILERLLPSQVDNRFDGRGASLWMLGLLIFLLFIVSLRSIVATASVAGGPDGLPLDSFGPVAGRTVLMLFALDSVGELSIALIALTILIRYRAMVPFIYLLLIGEQIGRRLILQAYAVPRTDGSISGWYVTGGVLGLLALGLLLSLLPRRAGAGR